MKVSINVTQYPDGSGATDLPVALAQVAEVGEEVGLDTIWLSDHLLQCDPSADPHDPMLEAYTTLGWIAARTSRIRLGTMVSAATYRAPALLIKAVTTLDVLSGGRAWLGVGTGYQQREADAMGLDLPPTSDRYRRLEDLLRLAQHMWSDDSSAFEGRTVSALEPISRPRPSTSPRPPILIGGTGEQKTFGLVARYGDACNIFDVPDGGRTIRTKLDALAERCAEVGREAGSISRTISTRFADDQPVSQFVEHLLWLAEQGLDHAVVLRPAPWDESSLTRLGEVVAALEVR